MTVSRFGVALLLAGVNGLVLGSPWTVSQARVLPRLRGGSSAEQGVNGAAEEPRKLVLVTGGAGYIGSHTCLELLKAGERVVVVDNLSNSDRESLRRVVELAECAEDALQFRECDLCDANALAGVFDEFAGSIGACVHFAGLKAVGESVAQPLRYYHNNVGGTVALLALLREHNVRDVVFSSSATVYGDPEELPVREGASLRATNPYGRTKLFVEEILRDLHVAEPAFWRIVILRYFNPVGAHASGRIGEDPEGVPNNLMPFISQVCVGRRAELSVFGGDYNTPDGTGVRDYIHVVDLALGHLAALRKIRSDAAGFCTPINLGTGVGVSVLDLVRGMELASGQKVPYAVGPRRPGDVASCYCDPAKARELLGWQAERGVADMCADSWKWQSNNPKGYEAAAASSSSGAPKSTGE